MNIDKGVLHVKSDNVWYWREWCGAKPNTIRGINPIEVSVRDLMAAQFITVHHADNYQRMFQRRITGVFRLPMLRGCFTGLDLYMICWDYDPSEHWETATNTIGGRHD